MSNGGAQVIDADPKTGAFPAAPKRSKVAVFAVGVSVVVMAAGFVLGRVTAPDSKQSLGPLAPQRMHDPGYIDPAGRVATSIALGSVREDGMSFETFVKARILRICPRGVPPARFTTGLDGATPSGAYLWHVKIIQHECRAEFIGHVVIASVWSDNGEVVGIFLPAQRSGSSLETHRLIRDQAVSDDVWFTQFKEGAAP